MPAFDYERATQILLDAIVMGDTKSSEKHNVTTRTIKNHRRRLQTDEAFAKHFAAKQERVASEWRTVRLDFLRTGIAKLKELVASANSALHITAVANAIGVVGELQVASDALDVDSVNHRSGQESASGTGGAQVVSIHSGRVAAGR